MAPEIHGFIAFGLFLQATTLGLLLLLRLRNVRTTTYVIGNGSIKVFRRNKILDDIEQDSISGTYAGHIISYNSKNLFDCFRLQDRSNRFWSFGNVLVVETSDPRRLYLLTPEDPYASAQSLREKS